MEKQHGVSIPIERITNKIFLVRGKKVMLDRDLAELYGVETREFNQAVRRNTGRFPADFMFQMTKEETEDWKSQIVISNRERMGLRKLPLAFTEHGVLMLSSGIDGYFRGGSLDTIENADEIFFVNAGELVQAGSMDHAMEMLLHNNRKS